ncbi:MAG: sigma-70 family RNA polymerase sigma factor [Terrimonas sp.]|nr:sigma-70 family RNA polymerase sigma factor [Terrimonas sp.]
MTDIELIHQYKRTGDLQHLGELYQRYMELVYGVCLKYFRDPEEAKDAVMQLFEELAVKLKKHEVENFRGWLHRVAKNHCLMKLRSPRNLKTIDIDPSLVQNEDNVHLNGALEKEENFVKMEKCLDSLTTEQQQMIRLFYLEGKCYNDIVQETGLAWNHVRSHIQNGRRNLKICMEAGETLTPTKKNV